MRGVFPGISKDDFGALALSSLIYWYITVLTISGFDFGSQNVKIQFSGWVGVCFYIVIPSAVGFILGAIEAGDKIGKTLRKINIRILSPEATAWETMFREMGTGSVLIVTLKDGTIIYGRWQVGSASSTDAKIMDLYLSEIGELDAEGRYDIDPNKRGAYMSAGEIRSIEVFSV